MSHPKPTRGLRLRDFLDVEAQEDRDGKRSSPVSQEEDDEEEDEESTDSDTESTEELDDNHIAVHVALEAIHEQTTEPASPRTLCRHLGGMYRSR